MAGPKIKAGDTVLVRAGKDKGLRGTVLKVYRDTDRVLVEGVAKKDATQLQGRAENNRVVLFPLDETNASLIGQLADVRIAASHDYYLRGELVANLDTIAKAS